MISRSSLPEYCPSWLFNGTSHSSWKDVQMCGSRCPNWNDCNRTEKSVRPTQSLASQLCFISPSCLWTPIFILWEWYNCHRVIFTAQYKWFTWSYMIVSSLHILSQCIHKLKYLYYFCNLLCSVVPVLLGPYQIMIHVITHDNWIIVRLYDKSY